MFGKIIGLATLPIDIAKDVATLGGAITGEKSATAEKIDFLSGKKEFEKEQERKDIETLAKIIKDMK